MEPDSEQFFCETFSRICGWTPYPWQQQLFLQMTAGCWPEVVPLPTGSGKTSVLQIWLVALAWSIRTGANNIPRRLAWVVNRRVVVDQVTEESEKLVAEGGGLEQCPELRRLLERVSIRGAPLAVSTLRGQRADNGEWACDPSTPAIVVGTVDMIGSRLLFRGYRCGAYHRPVHAGMLGADTLIVNDEAHLSPAFAGLLENLCALAPSGRLPNKNFRVLLLSATTADTGLKVFQHSPTHDAEQNQQFRRIFHARKKLNMHEVEPKAIEAMLFKVASENSAARTLVFIESPEKAAGFANRLEKDGRQVRLLTGTMRGLERDELVEDPIFRQFLDRYPPKIPVWLVATSAAEVGVNLTCERLVTGLVEADHLVQRFGRLNRFGTSEGEAHLVFAAPKEDEPRPKEARLFKTLEYLRSLQEDISCSRIWELQPPKEARSEDPACARLEKWLIETWAQTTYRDSLVPSVAPWLHGKEDEVPETEIAWRADVTILAEWRIDGERLEAILQRYPVRPHERLREPADRIVKKLKELVEKLGSEADKFSVIVVESDGSTEIVKLRELLESDVGYKLVILPDTLGKLEHGMFRPDLSAKVLDVADRNTVRRRYLIDGGTWTPIGDPEQRQPFEREFGRESLATFASERGLRSALAIRDPESEQLLVYFAETTGKTRELRDVPLAEHEAAVANTAYRLAECTGMGSLAEMFEKAGSLHDQGKHREVWQRAFGGKMETPIAKSKTPVNPRLLDGYRHELGSLVDAGETDDLVLHLIASHHKGARPYFSDRQLDRDNVTKSAEAALKAAQRYARLQEQFGPWGLAYLEAIFKSADGLVSAEEGGAESE